MTVMTDEWMRELKQGARRRISIIRKERGIKYGQGYSIRYLGRFYALTGKVYYLYEITNVKDLDMKTGLRTFDLFEDEIEEKYRPATYDEMMEIMSGLWTEVLYD
ncbi:MAG: hypothetical protein MJY58_06630 [Bacteroidaceae bacterium]|nr:hypothetical protein [Bacteroidaceae bacterium]